MAGEKEIKKAARSVGASVADQAGGASENVLQNLLKKGFVPQTAFGLSDAMLEGMYGQAYRLYNSGKYSQAAETFKFLVMINSTEPKYMMGLAASYHMLKMYDAAIQSYMMCGIIDPDSPIPHYHASDCHIQAKDPVSAIVALEMAVKRSGVKPEYQALKDRALLTIESLKKEMGKEQEHKKKIREKHKKK